MLIPLVSLPAEGQPVDLEWIAHVGGRAWFIIIVLRVDKEQYVLDKKEREGKEKKKRRGERRKEEKGK